MSVTASTDDLRDYRPAPAAGGTIAGRMDALPITWLHVAIVVIGSIGFAFDLMEVALGSALSAVFSAPPYSSDPTTLGWLLAAMYIGAIVGAPLAGWLADRHGRKVVLIGILLWLAVTSTAAAAAPDVTWLIIFRMLSGAALGAFPPLIIAYLTDVMPPGRRGMLIMIVAGLAALGPLGVIFLVRWLTPLQPLGLEAWRWAFLVGTVGSLIGGIAFLKLPESPRWLDARGRNREAEAACAAFERSGTFLASPAMPAASAKDDANETPPFDRRRFVVLSVIYFLAPWAVVAFPLLMGAVLIEKGFQLSDSLLYVGISMAGPVVGTLLAAAFVDRIERRTALAVFGVVMIAGVVWFGLTLEPAWLIASALMFQVTALLYVPTMTIYAAELFPTVYRGRTSATAYGINRIASALAPLVLLPLLKSVGVWAMFSVVIGSLALGVVVVLLFGERGRAAKAVD